MSSLRVALGVGLFAASLVTAADASRALAQEERETGRFRVGFHLDGTRTEGEIESESGNILTLEDPFLERVDRFGDPRNDTGALGSLNLGYGFGAGVSAAYQFTDRWSVEVAAGYRRSNAGDVEMQVQFDGLPTDETLAFQFDVYGIDAGTVEQVPLDLTFAARFRPKAAVRPYVGVGFGYMWVGFDPSDELDQLSQRMDASRGFDNDLQGSPFSRKVFAGVDETDRSLQGATVNAPDAWTWHVATGLEWAFRRNWSFVADLRYVGANKNFSIEFDGAGSLGRSVPDGIQTLPTDEAPDAYPYGAVSIYEGGLVDAGGLYIRAANDVGEIVFTPCEDIGVDGCQFYKIPDGALDTGDYYVQGGELRYSYLNLQLGVKFTF